MILKQPETQKEFEDMFDLRWRLLRKPWNQPKGSEKDDRENDSVNFIAVLDNKIIGTIRFQINENNEGQLRYLAVDDEYQRRGIATKLIREAESFAISKGISSLSLNGRKTAVKLFEKLGYKILKEGHTLFGEIEHFVMWKKLIYVS